MPMKKSIRPILLVGFLVLLSCAVKDGEIAGFQPSYGSIFVASTGASDARIFLDYKDTGLKTPALINNVRVGRHIIHVFLSNYNPDVDSIMVDVGEGEESSINFVLTNVATVGNLKVLTAPDSAVVFIDKLRFGYAPLEVSGLLARTHNIRIIKGGYDVVENNVQIAQNQTTQISENLSPKRLVLFEHFSNTYCQPCVQADIIIEDVIHQLGPWELVSLGYHPPIPGPADPFYLSAKPENEARRRYYDVPFSPYARMDGIKNINTLSVPQLEDNILMGFNERQQIQPKATIDIFDFNISVDRISGRAKITALGNLGTGIVLRIALIERSIDTAQPQGSNGQTHFFDVLRDFQLDAAGVPVSLSAGQAQSVNFEFSRQSEWGDDLEAIAFLQNNATKEVLQAVWTEIYH